MARPRKDKSQLGKPVAFRLPLHEYERFKQKVKESGLTQSEFFRRAIIDNETTVVAVPVQSETDQRSLFIMSKVSNNLNQLAHVMNAARLKGIIDRELCTDLFAKLDLILRYLKASR